MAEIRGHGEIVEVLVDQRERQALLQIVDRVRPMLEESNWAFPRAYEQEELEQEFQRLAGADLLKSREADLETLRGCLDSQAPIELTEEQTWSWLRALNALRLALAERLGLDQDGWEERFSPRQHRRPPLATLHLLSWVQEELVEALSGS
ncbi:MAG: DUF2017 family protein [Candidatus Dormibacteria bacterium]